MNLWSLLFSQFANVGIAIICFLIRKQQNINPKGNCVGSSDDGISATLLAPEDIAAPAITGFQDTADSILEEASVDQTEVILIFMLCLYKVSLFLFS